VAYAIAKMIQNPASIGQTYELAGPSVMTSKEVIEFVFQQIRRPPEVVDLPQSFLYALAAGMEMLPAPVITRDKLNLDSEDCVLGANSDVLTFEDLDMTPSGMEHISIRFLHQYRMGGHFLETA